MTMFAKTLLKHDSCSCDSSTNYAGIAEFATDNASVLGTPVWIGIAVGAAVIGMAIMAILMLCILR